MKNNILKVYQPVDPNKLIVEFSDGEQKLVNMRVLDMSGRMLISRTADKLSNEVTTLNIQDLNTDIYLVQIQTDRDIISRKIMISK